MITHNEIRKGVRIIIDGEPYEVIEAMPLKKAQRRVIVQSRIKNLISGMVLSRNFHQGDIFEEAEIGKFLAKFLYSHKGKFVFCYENDPSKRFELSEAQIGESGKFLKAGQIVEGVIFKDKIINVILPIKIQLKVIDAPPGDKAGRAQPGNKQVTLETKAQINVPLFVNTGDIIEINTETGEYVRRVD